MLIPVLLLALVILVVGYLLWLAHRDDVVSDYIDRRIEEINEKTPEGVEPDYTELWDEILSGGRK